MMADYFTEEFRAQVVCHNEYWRSQLNFPKWPPSVIQREAHRRYMDMMRGWLHSNPEQMVTVRAELDRLTKQIQSDARRIGEAAQQALDQFSLSVSIPTIEVLRPFGAHLQELHDLLEEEPEKDT